MKKPPRGAKFETVKVKKVNFLKGVLKRLNDDVGLYFELLSKYYGPGKTISGFWASLRMILPIIEAVSHAVGEKPQVFLEKYLDVKPGYLTWDLFRHSLIHGDYIMTGWFKDKEIKREVSIGSGDHIIGSSNIAINTTHLYSKLKEYLEKEIQKNDHSIIEIEVGVIYVNPKPEIIRDFDTVSETNQQ